MEFCENCKKIIDARINELKGYYLNKEIERDTRIDELEYLRDVFAKGMKE